MAPSDIQPDDVLKAVADYDGLGQQEFLRRYDFGEAAHFRIVRDGRLTDAVVTPRY